MEELAEGVAADDFGGVFLLEEFGTLGVVCGDEEGVVAGEIFFIDEEEVADHLAAGLGDFAVGFDGQIERLGVIGEDGRIAFEAAEGIDDAGVVVEFGAFPAIDDVGVDFVGETGVFHHAAVVVVGEVAQGAAEIVDGGKGVASVMGVEPGLEGGEEALVVGTVPAGAEGVVFLHGSELRGGRRGRILLLGRR